VDAESKRKSVTSLLTTFKENTALILDSLYVPEPPVEDFVKVNNARLFLIY
jgi:hypothetical protein